MMSIDAWVQLGIPGACLFLVMVIVSFMFKQQSSDIRSLCLDIKALAESFNQINITMATQAQVEKNLHSEVVENYVKISEKFNRQDELLRELRDMLMKGGK